MTAVHLSMWTYPWDVQDLGYETVEHDLKQRAGLNGISLATAYHAGRFLQPRSPRRKTYLPEDGTIYFLPTPGRWTDLAIQPKVADIVANGEDVLAGLIRRRDAGNGLAVNCWTVCLHNMRLGLLHPQAVTVNAFGDRSWFNLCPSHPNVRAYARALIADVTHTYRPDTIELESPSFMGYAHGYHHEKDGVGLTAEDDFLLSLCFCEACTAGAKRAGVDVATVRALVRDWLTDSFERANPEPRFRDFPGSGPLVFAPWPAFSAFLDYRTHTVASLVAELREAAHPATRVLVIDLADGWLGGCNLAAIAPVCDGAILCAYDADPEEVKRVANNGRQALGPEKYFSVGFRLFYPEMQGPADLGSKVRPALDAGVDGLNFYNYGLIPAARLNWIRAAVDLD